MTAERGEELDWGRTVTVLQWSRGSVTAERVLEVPEGELGSRGASMEPRFGDRGTVPGGLMRDEFLTAASMEPRFGDRGTLEDVGGEWRAHLLQWSRGSVTAERPTSGRGCRASQAASMEPRFGDRGTAARACRVAASLGCFNGAAVR